MRMYHGKPLYTKEEMKLLENKKYFLGQILKKEGLTGKTKKDIINRIKGLEDEIIMVGIMRTIYKLDHDPELKRRAHKIHMRITNISPEDLLRRFTI